MGDHGTDADYVKRFQEVYPPVPRPPSLASYASPERYDRLYMGRGLLESLRSVTNDRGGIAWGLSSRMASLNEMYRITGDPKYLEANLRCVEAVMRTKDDRRGAALWTGKTVKAWGSGTYASRGRAVFAVHTGLITGEILEFLMLCGEAGTIQQGKASSILRDCLEAISVHDRQWREGPGPSEGHYIGLDQEEVCENRPLPGNRLSAIGLSLWRSWRLAGKEEHRDRAVALGTYIKRRLSKAMDGAYYWPYWLPEEPAAATSERRALEGEDTSHALLTMALPMELAPEGQVFEDGDMRRLARTVLNGFARLDGGILFGDVTGSHSSDPRHIGAVAGWLPLAEFEPKIRDRILSFYLSYKPVPGPRELSRLILHALRG